MKVNNKNYSEKKSYVACINGECPQSASCLHYHYFQNTGAKPLLIKMLNPVIAHRQQGDCPHFKTTTPQQVAFGFITMLNSLPLGTSHTFIAELMELFGRKYYYQMRKGERYITKEEQALILDRARTHGATHLEFDRYDDVVVY